jgi:hypothetical protein
MISRLRAHMEKRPVDLGSRDSTLVFAVLLLGIFAISASVLIVVLVVTGTTSVREPSATARLNSAPCGLA